MPDQRPVTTAAVTALAPAVWGSTYLITTEFLPPDRPLLASTVRALPAGLVLLAVTRVLPRGIWWVRAAVLGILNIGAFFYFLFLAAYHLPGGVAALVMTVQPMIVLLLGPLLLDARIRPAHLAACVIAAGGVALLVLQPGAGLDLVGVIAGLLGAVSMAGGIVLTKRWGRPDGVSLFAFTGWQLTAGGLFLLPVTLLGESLPDRLTWGNVGGFGYLSIVGALLAYAVWFNGLARLPALAASFLSFASPLCATVLGYLFMGQTLGPLQLLGAAGVVGAVVLAQRGTPSEAARPPGSATSSAEGGPHGDDEEHQHEHGRHDAVSGLRVHPSSVTAPLTGPAARPAPPRSPAAPPEPRSPGGCSVRE
ncbi:EamA family transporter [Streptomyces sp. WZ.A104]|uniref:EamA family transporter n=1 Tax=Streptomyces sp. WZ.A104 TaxID=2023771 RepID=UPI000BBC2974|nr:EamA family transporter [Streptomyces sp. WZ.A104]PCG82405.1 EamA family transporter [Streptomyces sp. WZ.A104]